MFPANIMLSETFIEYYENLDETEKNLVKKSLFRLANRLVTKGMGLKKLFQMTEEVWECRCSRNYRMLMLAGNGCDFTLVYVGSHDDTSRIYGNSKQLPAMFKPEGKIIIPFEEYFDIKSEEMELIERDEDSDYNLAGGKLFGKYSLRKIKKLFSDEDMFLLNEVLDTETVDDLETLKDDLSPYTYTYLTWALTNGIDEVLSLIGEEELLKKGEPLSEEETRLENSPYISFTKKIIQSGAYTRKLFVANSEPCAYKGSMAMFAAALNGISIKKGSGKSLYLCSEKSHIQDMRALYKYLEPRYAINPKGRDPVSFYTPKELLLKIYEDVKDKAELEFRIFDFTEDCTLFMNVLSKHKKEEPDKYSSIELEDLFQEWQYVCCRYNAFSPELYGDTPRMDVRYDIQDQMLVLIPALIEKMKETNYYELGYAAYTLRNVCNRRSYHPFTDVLIVDASEIYPCIAKFAESLTDSRKNVQIYFSQTHEINILHRNRASCYYYEREDVTSMPMTIPSIGNETYGSTSNNPGDLSVRFIKDVDDYDKYNETLESGLDQYLNFLTEDDHIDEFDSSAILVYSNKEAKEICQYLRKKHIPYVYINDDEPFLKACAEKGIKVCTYRRAKYLLFSYVFAVDAAILRPVEYYDIDRKQWFVFEKYGEDYLSAKMLSARYDMKGFWKYMSAD